MNQIEIFVISAITVKNIFHCSFLNMFNLEAVELARTSSKHSYGYMIAQTEMKIYLF